MKRAVIAVIVVVAAILRLRPINDPDYHWHLATGRLILQRRAIPAVDPFSHTAAGKPWLFVDWLADVVMYLVWRVLGDAGNQVLFALLGALGIYLAAERARRAVPRANAGMIAAITLLVAAVVSYRITPRPQTAIFPLLAGLYLVLDAARTSARARLLPPVLIVVWQNVHSSAVLGVVVIVAYALEAVRSKRDVRHWLAMAAASATALLVAVRPLSRLTAGFAHLGDRRVSELFPEWGSPLQQGVIGAWVLAALVLILLSLIGAAGRAGTTGGWLSLAALIAVGVTSARFLPLVAIAAAPAALEGIVLMGENLGPRVVAAAASLLALGLNAERLERVGFGVAHDMFPGRAAQFIRDKDLRGNLFNDFHFGGYLIWTLSDRNPVFVDGRSMAVYGVEFVRDAALSTDAQLDAMIDRYGATIAVVPPDRRMGALQRRAGWALVSFDDTAAVLVNTRAVPHAEPWIYHAITPGRWFDVEYYTKEPGRVALAEREIARARAEAPDSSYVAVLAVTVALAARDYARAESALRDAEARFPHTQRVMRARLIKCMETNDAACACDTARKITKDYPNNTYAASARIIMRCP